MWNSPNNRCPARFNSALLTMGVALIVTACSSTGPTRDMEPAAAATLALMESPKPSAALAQLLSTLKPLGYDGVGLEFESDTTLEFLNRVFQSPRIGNRKIKLMYTGLALSYDPKHESLTIGGTIDLETILKYVEKSIPVRPPPAPAPATVQ